MSDDVKHTVEIKLVPLSKPPKKIPLSVTLFHLLLIAIVLACLGMLDEMLLSLADLLSMFNDFYCC